jgi:RsmE family RNA methyltransferase
MIYSPKTFMDYADHFKAKKNLENICIIIGSEEGFTENQLILAKECGADTVSLGPQILRAETAALVSVVQWQCLQNQLRK